ncbi:hypothetical protein POM88_028838 [Heracleum sosnowskyi]|uniref:Uncharacterized protein n=1 Tax=Heracleum sosnowskyi TaxID=360622 RepID=A0AAD8MED0_9APIA|nr:hypothetical protein POM88_028838 [Heracleum sosnowskyi]
MEAEHMKETEQIDDFSIKLNNIDEMTPHVLPGLTPKYLQPEKPLGTFLTGAVNDRASSSRAANEFWLWQGYEVKSEFIGILDCIAKKYPETFDNISVNSKKLYTMKLNMLCNIVKAFTETPMSEFNYNMIAEYRDLFANLQRSFNVKWLVDHLNYIEKLQFSHPLIYKLQAVDSRIEYAISKLQDLQALRVRMTKEIHRNVAVGYIGDLSIF